MGPVAVVVLVDIILRNRLAPRRATFELSMTNIDTSVDDVDIDTVAPTSLKLVLGEGSEGELGPVADACKTLIIVPMSHSHGKISALLTYPRSRFLDTLGLYNLITLNIIDFRHFPNPLEDPVREHSCVALDMAIVYVTNPAVITQVGILCMRGLEEVVMVI